MGADAAVERHDGTPPGEDEIAAWMRAGGLSPHGWGSGPGDTYGWHEHGYEKVLYCLRGQIVFCTADGDIRLGPGDKMVLPPHTAHAATVGVGRALHRSAPPARLEPADEIRAIRRTCPMTSRSPDISPRGKSVRFGTGWSCMVMQARWADRDEARWECRRLSGRRFESLTGQADMAAPAGRAASHLTGEACLERSSTRGWG
jgi:hypothetical protein